MNSLRTTPVLSLAFGVVVSGLSSYAMASVELGETLDLLLRVADKKTVPVTSNEDCRQIEMLALGQAGQQHLRFQTLAQQLFKDSCSGVREEDSASDTATQKAVDAVWDGEPLCRSDDHRILKCSHNPKTGRGIFAYSSTSSPENSPTLVCAHFGASSRSPFDYLQEVDNRCVVTEFDWRYEGSRSDVDGLTTWVNSPIGSAGLQIPAALKDQCRFAFADALYCTPTMIVIPEQDSTRVSLCGLKTRDQVFGLGPLLRISSSNSRWICESRSLLVPDRDQRLSVEERSCVPDHLGQLMNDYCRLPYMPVARRPVRTYLP